MDDALLKALLREKNARLRDKNQHIRDLQNLLWEAYHSGCDHSPAFEEEPIPTRQEEPVGINGTEELCAKIIEDV